MKLYCCTGWSQICRDIEFLAGFTAVSDESHTVSAVNHDKDFIANVHSDKENRTIRNRWMRALELYIHNNYSVFIHI